MSNRNSLSAQIADTRNVSRVKGIQFGVLSPDEIRNASVCEVTVADTYDGSEPKHHGLFDPRMGVVDLNRSCLTDHHDRQICPGHFGHIELAIPVFWVQYLDMVMKVLRCICIRCGNLLIDLTDPAILSEIKKRTGMARFNYVYQQITGTKTHMTRCNYQGGCGMIQPSSIVKIFMDKNDKSGKATNPLILEARYAEDMFPNQDVDTRWNLRPDYVYLLFRKLTDENIEYLGFSPKFSRPEWLICTVLPVCPPAVRPSVRQDNNQRSEDDLTCKLSDIINSNNYLKKMIDRNVDPSRIAEPHGLLQYNVATYVNNEMKKIMVATQRSGRPLKTLRQRLSSKDGRIRGNIMGKRVNYSARTVITPDANIEIDQWGVPERIAKNLTIPEVVTDFNREDMMELVLRGPMVHPGAKSVTKMNYDANGVPHPQEWSLRAGDRSRIVLEPGDIVMRHVRDGDICLFNRQPSLHRNSMMGHRVKVMQGSTFRLNASVCTPYNADFDGDEMNMHVPQSLQTRYELEALTLVPTQIFSPRGADSLIKSVYDAMTGMYLFTKQGKPVSRDELMNYLMIHHNYQMEPLPADRDGKWSAQATYSMFLPEVTYKSKNMSYADEPVPENDVTIEKGIIKQGIFDKKILGGGQGGLQKTLAFLYGNWAAKNLVDYTQQFMNLWLSQYGMSVGTGDVFSSLELLEKTNKIVQECHEEAARILAETHAGVFEPHLNTKFFFRSLESAILGVTQKGTQKMQNAIQEHITKDNRFMSMINAGAKGSKLNSQQTLGFVGTTSIMGGRVPFNFTHRTLPHFTKDDYGLESRGFIQHSFSRGMSPHELFFHLMGTRVGTIDTAIKSVTGDTTIIIMENDEPKYVKIGEWIDSLMMENKDKVQHLPEKEQELLKVSSIFIPTTDDIGNVSWGELTAVTRHDPGQEIYEIKTSGGRKVKVVESKSLIVWNEETKTFTETETPKVQIGDKLPVTAKLCAPSQAIKHLDISKYFPKEEYIYGTDFQCAKSMYMKETEEQKRVPKNWWAEHNGKTFTLPYKRSAMLKRAFTRSFANLKEGCIYPYHSHRNGGTIPEKMELNFENGAFIGIFIAEGNVDYSSGSVKITNRNTGVKEFVKKWFSNHNITYTNEVKTNKVGGISDTLAGYSRILGKFLKEEVGHLASNKRVPSCSFGAPIDFIRGLLSGYFSGDGCVTHNSIFCNSASSELIEGISMLCNRLQIFGKISKTQLKSNNLDTKTILPSYMLTIRSQWAMIFKQEIQMIDSDKQEKLQKMMPTEKHRNFDEQNDVVLDTITEINKLDVSQYPKVYDVTVPSTLNFGLANGLQVRDTADSGYLQRRLIKAMEDLSVQYDQTVRTAAKTIVEFRYGDDGFEPTKLQAQPLEVFTKSNAEMSEDYHMNEQDWKTWEKQLTGEMKKKWPKSKDTEKQLVQKEFEELVESRDELRNVDFKYNSSYEGEYFCPISFPRLLQKLRDDFGNGGMYGPPQFLPSEVEERKQKLMKEFREYLPDYSARLLEIQFRAAFSLKRIVYKERWNKLCFDTAEARIRNYFYQGLCSPGEMVGTLTGQMIGEPATQMTLNSIEYNTPIWLRLNGSYLRVRAGEWIDQFMNELPAHLKEDHGNNTHLGWTPQNINLDILSVDDLGNTSWKKVEAATVHPPINQDCTNTLVKITTVSGRTVTATKAKSFLVFDPQQGNKVIPIRGDELKLGMMMPIAYRDCAKNMEGGYYGYQEGYVMGRILAGSPQYQGDKKHGIETQQVVSQYMGRNPSSEEWNSAFLNHPEWCYGVLKGFMDINVKEHEWSTPLLSEEWAEWFSWLAGRLGQTTRWEQDGAQYVVRSDFSVEHAKTGEIWGDPIREIEEVQSAHPWVYDFTVEDTRNFVIANGMGMRDTFHLAGVGEKSVITTTGVPRMREIVSLGKDIKTPSMSVFLKEPYRSDVQKAKELKSKFEFTQLGSLLKRSRILFDPVLTILEGQQSRKEFEEEDEFMQLYHQFANAMGFPVTEPEDTSSWVLRLEFDRTQMMNHNLRMADIRRVIENNSDLSSQIQVTFSDDNAGDLIMRVRIKGDWEEEDPVAFLQELEHKHLSKIVIQGIQGIQRVSLVQRNINEINAEGKRVFKKEWIIETDGINVFDVLMFDFVDAERMMINDFHSIKDVFGIEAARALLLHEFRDLMNKADLKELNYRHLAMVVDVMTYRGILMPIDRHGMKRSPDISPFAKASNEESTEIMVNSSIFADIDRVAGVSSNILLGQQYQGGTNAFEILLDEEQIRGTAPKYTQKLPEESAESTQTLYEEIAGQTLWNNDQAKEIDIVEEIVEESHPEHAGFMENDPFSVQWDGDRLQRLGLLQSQTSIPRPPLFRSQKQWIHKQ